MNIVTEYPTWYIILCILLGLGYSSLLYYKERFFEELSIWVKRVMAVLRFLLVTFLALLLLNPLLKTFSTEVEKPIIIVAQDNSNSIVLGKDSAYYKNDYKQEFNSLVKELSEKYDVKTHSFSDAVSDKTNFEFSGKQTDISEFLNEVTNTYSNRNVGAIVLATDGIYNKGASPLYLSSEIGVPFYNIALGDTSIKKDVVLKKVVHNRLAYLGNDFPLQMHLAATRYAGNNIKVTVSKNGRSVFEQAVQITQDDFFKTISVLLEAEKTGIQKYLVTVSQLDGEANYTNNSQLVYIDVLDSRQKVLILAASPHPDIAALRNAIENNDNYETETKLAANFEGNFNEYNLVILHQLPNNTKALTTKIKTAVNGDTPLLFIVGNNTQIQQFNQLKLSTQIAAVRNQNNESRPALNESFTLFQLSDKTRASINNFPPLFAPFGEYKASTSAQVLFTQKIGLVNSGLPLVLFSESNNKKVGVITGEGVWQWRLADFLENGNHNAFNEIIGKSIQYLAIKDDKSLFKVKGKNNYQENEPIVFEAEVYNESYELYNEPEVKMEISNSAGNDYSFTFSRNGNSYRLDAGNLPIGEYTYTAQTKVGSKVLKETGEFTINEIRIESINTVADHQLLYNIASKTGGEMLYPNELNTIDQKLAAREEIKSVSFSQKKLLDIINLKWIFFLLLALVSIEWFLRKRNGGY